MRPGDVFRLSRFYFDRAADKWCDKFLLILATPRSGDAVGRLLTSRAHGRKQQPPCYHGDPYAGFFLGALGEALPLPTWVDLRYLDDFDTKAFADGVQKGTNAFVLSLAAQTLRAAAECVAESNDASQRQYGHIRDMLAGL